MKLTVVVDGKEIEVKRVIVLEKLNDKIDYRVCLWAAVPAGRETVYADSNKTSAWDSADAAEVTALKAGQVAEHVETVRRKRSDTEQQWQALLQAHADQWQAEVDGDNPRDKYGTHWDGATWTNSGTP